MRTQNIRYLKAESLMCLLLPKKAVLLPWRAQPKVIFGFTFKEWQAFIAERKGGSLRNYREIRQMPEEEQKRYFYADACLSQFYELLFSGSEATNIIATETVCSEQELIELIKDVSFDKKQEIAQTLTRLIQFNGEVVLPDTLSSLCLIYCFNKSIEGGTNIWTSR